MFGTATTFSYHNPSSQNAKGLLNSITLPSATQLLVTLPFGYFAQGQDRAPQQTVPSQNISHPTPPSPPPPQQQQQLPVHNKRKQQRKSLLQNSFSAAIASTFAGGNMGSILSLNSNNNDSNNNNNNNNNNNSVTTNNNAVNDSTNKRSPAAVEPSPPPQQNSRRKKQSNKINRKKIDQAIAFSAFSVEEDHQGNPGCANDLYFLALEQLLEAFPTQNDQSRRAVFLHKLKSFLERAGLIDEFMEMTQTSTPSQQIPSECGCTLPQQNNNNQTKEKGVSDLITSAVVTSAVALKQSPIPDAISATVNYTTKIIKNIDEAYELQDKAWKISRTGINLALELDQQYNVHERVGHFCFTTIAAIMKAGIAYKDSPSYRDLKRQQEFFSDDSACIVAEE